MPVEPHVVLRQRERLAGRDPQLRRHEVDAGDRLGHGVLDLQARVDLEEVEVLAVEHELDRAGVDVARGLGDAQRGLPHARPQLGPDRRRRRLLQQLLVAALQRALALAEVHAAAVRVAQHLHLDVPRRADVALEVHRRVAERRLRGLRRRRQRRLERLVVLHDLHADAAAARRRLDDQRVAELGRGRARRVGVRDARAARRRGDAVRLREVARRELRAQQPHRLRAAARRRRGPPPRTPRAARAAPRGSRSPGGSPPRPCSAPPRRWRRAAGTTRPAARARWPPPGRPAARTARRRRRPSARRPSRCRAPGRRG